MTNKKHYENRACSANVWQNRFCSLLLTHENVIKKTNRCLAIRYRNPNCNCPVYDEKNDYIINKTNTAYFKYWLEWFPCSWSNWKLALQRKCEMSLNKTKPFGGTTKIDKNPKGIFFGNMPLCLQQKDTLHIWFVKTLQDKHARTNTD